MRDELSPLAVGAEPLPLTSPLSARRDEQRNPERDDKRNKRTGGNRFNVLNLFLDCTAGNLPRSEMLVWMLLYRDTKPDGIARTSQADLARRANADLSTIKRATAKLERRGLLIVVRRGNLQRGPSAYRVVPLIPTTKLGGVDAT